MQNGLLARCPPAAATRPRSTGPGWLDRPLRLQTTEVYADFAPDPSQGAAFAERAFGAGTNSGTNLSASESNSAPEKPRYSGESQLGTIP